MIGDVMRMAILNGYEAITSPPQSVASTFGPNENTLRSVVNTLSTTSGQRTSRIDTMAISCMNDHVTRAPVNTPVMRVRDASKRCRQRTANARKPAATANTIKAKRKSRSHAARGHSMHSAPGR